MCGDLDRAKGHRTAIAPMLSVRRGAQAIEFYKAALGADVLFRIDSDTGEVLPNCLWRGPNSGSQTSLQNT